MQVARWTSLLAVASVLVLGGWSAGAARADGMPSRGGGAERVERGVWFGGYDTVKGSDYYFDGIIVALNGNMNRDGLALRLYGSRVDYDLDPGNGRGYQGDIMLGYQFTRGITSGAIFVGVDYQDYKLSPDDPTAQVRGSEVGFAVAGNLETSRDQPYYVSLAGKYSTAFDTYWGRIRTGLNRGRFTFGPEAIAYGDTEFDAQRLGGFLTFDLKLIPRMPLEVTLSAGHQWANDSTVGGGGPVTSVGGGDGTYGSIVFSTTF